MFVQTVIGSRFLLTRSSMIVGRLDSNMVLHSASRVGEPITEPRVWQRSGGAWVTKVEALQGGEEERRGLGNKGGGAQGHEGGAEGLGFQRWRRSRAWRRSGVA